MRFRLLTGLAGMLFAAFLLYLNSRIRFEENTEVAPYFARMGWAHYGWPFRCFERSAFLWKYEDYAEKVNEVEFYNNFNELDMHRISGLGVVQIPSNSSEGVWIMGGLVGNLITALGLIAGLMVALERLARWRDSKAGKAPQGGGAPP